MTAPGSGAPNPAEERVCLQLCPVLQRSPLCYGWCSEEQQLHLVGRFTPAEALCRFHPCFCAVFKAAPHSTLTLCKAAASPSQPPFPELTRLLARCSTGEEERGNLCGCVLNLTHQRLFWPRPPTPTEDPGRNQFP